MNDDAGAERAIRALDGTKMGDRTLNVRFAEEKTEKQANPGKGYQKLFTRSDAQPHDNRSQKLRSKRQRK